MHGHMNVKFMLSVLPPGSHPKSVWFGSTCHEHWVQRTIGFRSASYCQVFRLCSTLPRVTCPVRPTPELISLQVKFTQQLVLTLCPPASTPFALGPNIPLVIFSQISPSCVLSNKQEATFHVRTKQCIILLLPVSHSLGFR